MLSTFTEACSPFVEKISSFNDGNTVQKFLNCEISLSGIPPNIVAKMSHDSASSDEST